MLLHICAACAQRQGQARTKGALDGRLKGPAPTSPPRGTRPNACALDHRVAGVCTQTPPRCLPRPRRPQRPAATPTKRAARLSRAGLGRRTSRAGACPDPRTPAAASARLGAQMQCLSRVVRSAASAQGFATQPRTPGASAFRSQHVGRRRSVSGADAHSAQVPAPGADVCRGAVFHRARGDHRPGAGHERRRAPRAGPLHAL